MVSENNELIMELWSRMKSHIQPKERLEVADILINVFDEFNLVEDDLLDEDLDKELRAAVRSHLPEALDEEDDDREDRYDE
jgi:hypothetical protein